MNEQNEDSNDTIGPIEKAPKPLTPAELIEREFTLASKLAALGQRYPVANFQYQLGCAMIGCENRIRAIQLANNMEVTV